MPELAEVEFYRKRWDAGLDAKVVDVRLHSRKRIFRGVTVRELRRQLIGRTLLRSTTFGKRMLFEFSGNNWLGIHLGMTGKLHVEPAAFRAQKHDHLVLYQQDHALVFTDSRLFGRVQFHHGPDTPAWWFFRSPAILSSRFNQRFVDQFLQRHRRAPIKSVLLLQDGFPGIGNWMADEILWRAKIAPATPVGQLSARQRACILRFTRFVAHVSLQTLGHDFSDPPRSWLLHQRWKADGVCPRDRLKLSRDTIAGRTTVWCLHCQGSAT